jgi:hypothetical protein
MEWASTLTRSEEEACLWGTIATKLNQQSRELSVQLKSPLVNSNLLTIKESLNK